MKTTINMRRWRNVCRQAGAVAAQMPAQAAPGDLVVLDDGLWATVSRRSVGSVRRRTLRTAAAFVDDRLVPSVGPDGLPALRVVEPGQLNTCWLLGLDMHHQRILLALTEGRPRADRLRALVVADRLLGEGSCWASRAVDVEALALATLGNEHQVQAALRLCADAGIVKLDEGTDGRPPRYTLVDDDGVLADVAPAGDPEVVVAWEDVDEQLLRMRLLAKRLLQSLEPRLAEDGAADVCTDAAALGELMDTEVSESAGLALPRAVLFADGAELVPQLTGRRRRVRRVRALTLGAVAEAEFAGLKPPQVWWLVDHVPAVDSSTTLLRALVAMDMLMTARHDAAGWARVPRRKLQLSLLTLDVDAALRVLTSAGALELRDGLARATPAFLEADVWSTSVGSVNAEPVDADEDVEVDVNRRLIDLERRVRVLEERLTTVVEAMAGLTATDGELLAAMKGGDDDGRRA